MTTNLETLTAEMTAIESQYGDGPFSAMPAHVQACYSELFERWETAFFETLGEDDGALSGT